MADEPNLQTIIQTIDNDSNVPVFFTNIASTVATPEEFIINFGIRTLNEPNKGKGVAIVYLSPSHAKRLAEAMARTVESYERNFGKIISDPENRLTLEGKKLLSNGKLIEEIK